MAIIRGINTVERTVIEMKHQILDYIRQLECEKQDSKELIKLIKEYIIHCGEVIRTRGINDPILIQLLYVLKTSVTNHLNNAKS